jgi:hypothetical protein
MVAVSRAKGRLIVLTGCIVVLALAVPRLASFMRYFPDFCYPYRYNSDVADLDGDGDPDLIVHMVCRESPLTSFGSTVLWINQGRGRFSRQGLEFPPYLFLSVGAADIDRDGDADLMALSVEDLWPFLNRGGAQGGEPGAFKVNNPAQPPVRLGQDGSLVLGDLNGDRQPDGFIAGCCGKVIQGWGPGGDDAPSRSWVWIDEWDPRGWLVRHSHSVPELDGLPVRAAALGDLDGDGDLDAFAAIMAPQVGLNTGPADLVLLNDGTGHFTDSGQRLGSTDSTSVALGDLDRDGDLDALVGTSQGAVVWINQGGAQGGRAGIFAGPGREMAGTATGAVFLADMNGDGSLDALVAGKEQAAVWWNDGRGTFTPSNQRFRYAETQGVAVHDFDADGRSDIVAAGGRDYRIWFNQGNGAFSGS